MNATHLFRLAWAGVLTACTAASSQLPVLVAPDLLSIVTARDKVWSQPRTPLALSGGRASNCASYARLRPSGVLDDTANQRVKSEYLVCDVLEQLGPTPNVKTLAAGNYGSALASRLDLRSFPSSLGPMVDEQHYTLSQLFGSQVSIEGDGAAVKTSDMSFSLTIVAAGDLDHSGGADWIVWLSDEVLAGTYRGYQTLLIRNVAPVGLLRAQSL
jgi:hypothetical protein